MPLAFDASQSAEWLWTGYAVTLNATLFLAGMAALAWAARRAPAAFRARLWALAVVGTGAVALIATPPYGSGRELVPVGWYAAVVPDGLASPMVALGSSLIAARAAPGLAAEPPAFGWAVALCALWVAGVALVLARLAAGWLAVRRLTRAAAPVDDPAWLGLLDEVRAELGVRPVSLRRHGGVGTPLTWGTLRPVVLLPAGADGWPAAHRRAVLLHEMEHVRRHDCLVQVAGRAACALFWFHPLLWWAAGRLAAVREEACDARVLRAGLRPSDYAECLLRVADLARLDGAAASVAVSAGMARPSRLKHRLHRILRAPGGPAPSRLSLAAAALAGVALLLLAASVRLNPQPGVFHDALRAEHWAMRAHAVLYLAHRPTPREAREIGAVLARDPDPRVRRAVELLQGRPH